LRGPRCVSVSGTPPIDLTGLAVLVVEDDRDSLDVLETMLRSCGAEVLGSRTARGALVYIDTTPKLDVVITDISMPDMDGTELARRIRRHPTASRLPILAITAFYEDYANRAEFNAYLRKPVDLDRLCSIVARLARNG